MRILVPEEDATIEEKWEWFTEHFTREMEGALYKEAYRILQNHQDVEDVLQESMIIGAENCQQLSDGAKLFSWMFSIVRHEAGAYRTKFSAKRVWKAGVHSIEIRESAVELEYYVISKEEKDLLAREIRSLPPDTQDIIRMKCSTDMKLREIAVTKKMNYQTVRSRYQRALKWLKIRLEGDRNEKESS